MAVCHRCSRRGALQHTLSQEGDVCNPAQKLQRWKESGLSLPQH
jgi:hypothetical protein